MDTPNTPSTEPQADIMSELLRNVDRTVHSQIAQMFTGLSPVQAALVYPGLGGASVSRRTQ